MAESECRHTRRTMRWHARGLRAWPWSGAVATSDGARAERVSAARPPTSRPATPRAARDWAYWRWRRQSRSARGSRATARPQMRSAPATESAACRGGASYACLGTSGRAIACLEPAPLARCEPLRGQRSRDLRQRALQAREVALLPRAGGSQAAAVEVDHADGHAAVRIAAAQHIVRIEVCVIRTRSMQPRNHCADLVPYGLRLRTLR